MRIKPDFWQGPDRICWLCALMAEFLGTNSLKYAPVVLSNMASISTAPTLKSSRQAIFNLRQMSLAFTTKQSIEHNIALYNDHHYCQKMQGTYIINAETMEFTRTDLLEDPLIAKARKILQSPLPYELQKIKIANPHQSMVVSLGEGTTAIRIPVGPITAPLAERKLHDFSRQPRGKIEIPLDELRVLAKAMDDREADVPERRQGNWESRLQRFELMVSEHGEGLRTEKILKLEGIKHAIGLPGAGKTTILVLMAVWLGQNGYKAMFIFPSIEVSRQYLVDLAFHGVRVGMLVGQSEETRRQHADNLAEAIAASGGNGGFARTIEGSDLFGLNCVLPAFSSADTSAWGFGYAPCNNILQGENRQGKMNKCWCPVWTVCGRNQSARELVDADIWVGHIRSLDTQVPAPTINERVRYFELLGRTFDLVVFDEADLVQSNLDSYGAAALSISGSEKSIHRVIQSEIHNRFARGENYRLSDRDVELYSRDLSEFGNHNTSLISVVQNLREYRVGERYEGQLLTVLRIVSELLDGLEKSSQRDRMEEREVQLRFKKNRALTDFWETSAYHAFYDRTGMEPEWEQSDQSALTLGIARSRLERQWKLLIRLFRRYLAENTIERRDKIIDEIADLFLKLCFSNGKIPHDARDVIRLLIVVTFVIVGYQRIVPRTKTMVAEGLIREPILQSTATPELRHIMPENILGSFSGVRYRFLKASSTRTIARNVEISYITFVSAPRMLMHRFHHLFAADGEQKGPAVLMTSATSFLESSPAYHINTGPHYLLKPLTSEHNLSHSKYCFKWISDPELGDKPLRYSGAGDSRDRNLEKMVEALVRGGTRKSEVYKSILNFDKREGICRKAAFVVNSYEQGRSIVKFLNTHHPEVGRRTKAVVHSLREGERSTDFVTTAQCEALGDDETCDIIIFPMLAMGRGVNIVFTKGSRKLDAAIGSIYFLTRPHPSTDDMQLLYSLAGRSTQAFDEYKFTANDDLAEIAARWQMARKDLLRYTNQLLREPLMASRLGSELFQAFTANQMVAILQTIGRGMRNGCPVAVYFVDAAWAIQSTKGEPDSGRNSMLVQMRIILEECVNHPDPIKREIYQELYTAFLEPLRKIEGVIYPKDLRLPEQLSTDDDDEFSPLLEL
jgi:pPIWI RE three-gene island domain Z